MSAQYRAVKVYNAHLPDLFSFIHFHQNKRFDERLFVFFFSHTEEGHRTRTQTLLLHTQQLLRICVGGLFFVSFCLFSGDLKLNFTIATFERCSKRASFVTDVMQHRIFS